MGPEFTAGRQVGEALQFMNTHPNRKRRHWACEALGEFADLMVKMVVGTVVLAVAAYVAAGVVMTLMDQLNRR